MATCDICGNEFRNNSGLSGHKQLAHRLESAYSSASSSALERSTERFAKRSEALEDRLVQQFEERLMDQIQPQLDRIERAASLIEQVKRTVVEEHRHGMSDPECAGCIELVSETLRDERQKGIDETVAYYEAIPGVKHLRETYQQLLAAGKDPEEELIHITG